MFGCGNQRMVDGAGADEYSVPSHALIPCKQRATPLCVLKGARWKRRRSTRGRPLKTS